MSNAGVKCTMEGEVIFGAPGAHLEGFPFPAESTRIKDLADVTLRSELEILDSGLPDPEKILQNLSKFGINVH